MQVRNFLFHRVSDEIDSLWPPMKPKLFERIIKLLVKHYQVVPLESFLADPDSFKSKKKIATVLFDDGYKDNIEFAAPILQKYNCPASFYIVTDCIDCNTPTWTYLVDNAFQKTSKESIELNFSFAPESIKRVFPPLNHKESNVAKIKPWMKSIGNRERVLALNEILEQCNDVETPKDKMMGWQDIKQMWQHGFIIGSHSHTHPLLATIVDEEEIKEELNISYRKIQAQLGVGPLSISYPVGSFDDRVKKIAKEYGYQFGLAVKQKFYHANEKNLFEIPRVELYQERWWKTRMRMNGLYSFAKMIKK